MSPAVWFAANHDEVHRGSIVRLEDGRRGVIRRVGGLGWPVVELDGGGWVRVHPDRIAARVG